MGSKQIICYPFLPESLKPTGLESECRRWEFQPLSPPNFLDCYKKLGGMSETRLYIACGNFQPRTN